MNPSSAGHKEPGARRLQLVLDIGGVLATNLSPLFWELAARAAGSNSASLYGLYKRDISPKLWRGEVDEAAFWDWLARQAPGVGASEGRAMLAHSLRPLPAMDKLPSWSRFADIHIVSNHLAAWIEPLLAPYRAHLRQVTVSSEVGWQKPQPEIFAYADSRLPAGAPVLFVDDQPRNLRQAEALSWRVLLADEQGRWAEEIDRRLGAR